MRFAVLTGDIVASTRLPADALHGVMAQLSDAAESVSDWHGNTVTGYARRGGDGWQMVIDRPELSLRAALFLIAVIREGGPDRATRIAIAEGEGTVPGGTRPDPNAGHGPVFIASGRRLDSLPRNVCLAHDSGGSIGAAARLADALASGWTPAQARALCHALPPGAGPRKEIARKLGVSREAVNQALWSAHFPAIEDALKLIEGEA